MAPAAVKSSFIPFHRPSIGQEEIQEVADTLRSGWLTTGPKTHQFEEEFRRYIGAPFALAVNSATAGLHLTLASLNLAAGDEVITTPMTFCSTVHAIRQAGAQPVLADVLPDGNIDPASVRDRITSRTRGVLPVHLGGLPCRMTELWNIAAQDGLFVLEDAAHAVGSRYLGYPIGGGHPELNLRSAATVFSFYATKNLTTGEGGMVTTHDASFLERMRLLCLHGISKDAWDRYTERGTWFYQVIEAGYKYNLSDLQSAVGMPQWRKQEAFISVRRHLAAIYDQWFRNCPELELPPDSPEARHCWHLYILRLNLERLACDRGEFIMALKQRGICCSVHFIPIPLHPAFADLAADSRKSSGLGTLSANGFDSTLSGDV